jgi:TatD DNase family protein
MGAADIGGDRPGERLRESRSAERDAQPDHADEHVIVRTHLDAGVRAVVDHAAVRVIAVITIADDVEAARWVVRAADWDPRVYASVSE